MLIGTAQERNQRDMNKETVLTSYLKRNLSCRLYEGLRFNIAYGSSYLRYYYIRIRGLADLVYEFLNLIGDMGYDLHGRSKILSSALLIKYIPIYLAGCKV